MKWSEQMRVLQSEDEHYNQLIYDVEKKELYINDKLIANLDEDSCLDDDTFWDLKKKYPYIDDKNFLLNCLFKLKAVSGNPKEYSTSYLRTSEVEYMEGELLEQGSSINVIAYNSAGSLEFSLIKSRTVTDA